MSKPSIVFIGGCWHQPEHYKPVTSYLEQQGYHVLAPLLPSNIMGKAEVVKDIQPDISAARKTILAALESNNVVLIAHSYGGIPASSAVKGLDTKSRHASGHEASVLALGYIASFMLPEGTSLGDISAANPSPPGGPFELDINPEDGTWLVSGDVRASLWHDCTDEGLSKRAHDLLLRQSMAIAPCPNEYSAYKDYPTSYLVCTEDRTVLPDLQRKLLDMARKDGGQIQGLQVKSSHSPHLSRPQQLGDWIRGIAGEDIACPFETY